MNKLIGAMLAAGILVSGSAHADYYRFRFQGLEYGPDHIYRPYLSLGGKIVGEDLDNDGIIELNELTSFETKWGDLRHCFPGYMTCTFNRFSFAPDGALDFDIRLSRVINGMSYVLIWESDGLFLDKNLSNGNEYGHFNATPQTTLYVQYVPEPLSISMLSLGLGFIALRSRKQKTRASNSAAGPTEHRLRV